ncbi:hypothetical protein [Labrys neptuniae]
MNADDPDYQVLLRAASCMDGGQKQVSRQIFRQASRQKEEDRRHNLTPRAMKGVEGAL